MLPFRKMTRDVRSLEMCVEMIEGTVDDIEDCLNVDDGEATSLSRTLSLLLDAYGDLLDDLDDDERMVNPRLHFNRYPLLRRRIRGLCDRCEDAVERLSCLVETREELDDIECYANGEMEFGVDF